MTIKNLYRYSAGNEIVVSPEPPPDGTEYTSVLKRLIADDGRILICGEEKTTCVDVPESGVEDWCEEQLEDEEESSAD